MADRTILLAEDDDMVRSFVCSVLQGHGYRMLPAANGLEALRLAKRVGPDGIDLVLTDVDMPALNGFDLVKCLKQLRPDLKVLFMTGHRRVFEDELRDKGMVIEKPFAYGALVRGVAACLAEETSLAESPVKTVGKAVVGVR
jgi:two-component system cell cycle sensor histidine kinase/response regulator CckA